MRLSIDRPPGQLVLADGSRFEGRLAGAPCAEPVVGEVVFNTSMTGYTEVLTDPSYAGQIVAMTAPHIGNHGVVRDDFESTTVAARALVVCALSETISPGPGSRATLEAFLREHGVACLCGVDTRTLTLRVREHGAMMGVIARADLDASALAERARAASLDAGLVEAVAGRAGAAITMRTDASGERAGREHAASPAPAAPGGATDRPGARARVALLDLGAKHHIVHALRSRGLDVCVLDARDGADAVLEGDFDGVVLSNGPGDPLDVPFAVDAARALIGRLPVLGICLGHQVAALALGGRTYKLRFGHHGANHPVRECATGRVVITSQNHNFAVDAGIAERDGVRVTWVNAADGTLEGFDAPGLGLECVQFHPEAAPGPHDAAAIFDRFAERVEARRRARA